MPESIRGAMKGLPSLLKSISELSQPPQLYGAALSPSPYSKTVGYVPLSLKYKSNAVCNCFMSAIRLVSRALLRAWIMEENTMEDKSAITEIMTNSSIKVKPIWLLIVIFGSLFLRIPIHTPFTAE